MTDFDDGLITWRLGFAIVALSCACADCRTSRADLRTAMNIARGIPLDQIHPGTGYAYTDAGYADRREVWHELVMSECDVLFHRRTLAHGRELQREFLDFRPELDPADWFPECTAGVCETCRQIAEIDRILAELG